MVRCAVFLVLAGTAYAASANLFEGHADIGAVLHPGSVDFDSATGKYMVTGSGANMWFAEDDFHFVWKRVSGDVSLAATVSLIGAGGDPHRKAVLMIRQSLDADSAYADAALHGDGLTSLQFRAAKGEATHEIQSNRSAPKRLLIEKRGDFFYLSVGGSTQDLQFAGGSMRIPMRGTFYIGIGVCAHDKDAIQKAVFSDVSFSTESHAVSAYRTLETLDVRSTDARVSSVVPEPISPDGFLYFGAEAKGTLQIWRRHPDGSNREQVTFDAVNNAFPDVSPDGTRVAFLSWDKKLGKTPDRAEMQLRVMLLADKTVRVVATFTGGAGSLVAPAWSLDGRRLGFTSYQEY